MSEAGRAAPNQPVQKTVEEWRADAERLEQAGRMEEADRILCRIIEARPNYHPAWHQAGILSWKRKRPRQAAARFERALQLAPDNALYFRNACEIFRGQSRLDEALACATRAVQLAPNDSAAHYNLGVVRYDRLEIGEAEAAIRRSLELDPNNPSAHFELAESLLLTGQFEEGWKEYEWRFSLPNAPPLLPPSDRPMWDGKPMPDGKLMLIGDQGFGDTIQFCRYIPLVAERCSTILMAASKEMQPLLAQQKGVTRQYDRWQAIPSFDAYCSLSGLPRLFGTNLSNIPAGVPYLKPDPAKTASWRARLDKLTPRGYRRIGLGWAGRPTHGNDFNRSVTLKRLKALTNLKNTVFVSLQMGPAQAEIGNYFGEAPLINLGAEITDFTDTMAILDGLDRLVAVDTSLVHLAGAMGRPISVLVPYAPDWRWLLGRSDSPWYPTMTLHRQDGPGDWGSAIAKVVALLESEASARRSPKAPTGED